MTDDVMKCQLKPMVREDYPVTFTDEQWQHLQEAFPTGVCDYTKPGVSQRGAVAWLTYQDRKRPGDLRRQAARPAAEVAPHQALVARLEQYSFGRIVVDGEEHTRDLIVLPDRVVPDWWRRDGHSLAHEDLDEVRDELPERLILGCGAHGQLKPDPAVIEALERQGIEVVSVDTAEAVRRYGDSDERRTAAALHLTC